MKMNQSQGSQNGCSEQTEKEENGMESIVDEFSTYICDHICKYPEQIKDQEELQRYCDEHCEHSKFHCAVLNQYNKINSFDYSQAMRLMNKYKNIVLCEECEYKIHLKADDRDYCLRTDGMCRVIKAGDGCSIGRKR